MRYSRTENQLKSLLQELLQADDENLDPVFPDHNQAIEPWRRAMAGGTLTGKVFSTHTVDNYTRYIKEYLLKHPSLTFEGFREEMETVPPEMFGRKNKYYKAIVCFAKFLIRERSLNRSFLGQAVEIKPKRHIPPKQTSINEEQLKAVLNVCKRPLEKLIITMLSSTGLRASEFCSLKLKDLYLEEGYLVVERGKGGKRRRVGLSPKVVEMLNAHLLKNPCRSPEDFVFKDRFGDPMRRDGLQTRVRRLGRLAGLEISPHVLRRAFVTINANKGRSLVMLQMACGHSDIKTTRSYCKTSEDEMIQAMRDW